MTMNASKLLFLVSTILFAIAFVITAFTNGNGQTVLDLLYGGLTTTAAGLLLG